MYQRIVIVGRLGKDPERFEANTTTVTKFSVAVNYRWGKNEATEWYSVAAFGGLADSCYEYLDKGRLVTVEGFQRTSSWEDDEGETRYKTELIADKVIFMPRGSQGDDDKGTKKRKKRSNR